MRDAPCSVGSVRIVPLLDAVTAGSLPVSEKFPGSLPPALDEARERHPGVFEGDRWRLHVRCFAVRSQGRTILVDTGVGPESRPAFSWAGVRGRLPEELAAAGIDPADVDTVVITHVHDDHLGWTTDEAGTGPLFVNARYLVHPADWDLMASSDDPEDRAIFEAELAPLEHAGVLDRSGDGLPITSELTLEHAPGHTPGHQVLVIDSDGERAIVSADLVNHPVQLLQPGVNGTSDFEPVLAAATRARLLDRIEREGRLVAPSHFAEPFGRIERDGHRWRWRPLG
jgi:glyoxylase-like metal-dependent hydrolase (beta-lactamase superfamily II)